MSTTNENKLIVILGSGPGIGVGVASLFASRTFNRVALLSRNSERLQVDAESVRTESKNKDAQIKTYAIDLADSKGLEKVLGDVERELGTPEVVVYNASHLTKSKLFAYGEGDVEFDLKVSAIGLYTTAKWALPHLTSLAAASPTRKPALLVTSGGLYKSPFAPYFSLSMSKAAQHSLTMSLAQEFSKKGVHVAAVVVHGLVKPDSEFFSPRVVAEAFWGLYQEGSGGEKEIWVTAPEEDEKSKEWRDRKASEEKL